MLVIFVFFVLNSDYFFNSSIFVKDSWLSIHVDIDSRG